MDKVNKIIKMKLLLLCFLVISSVLGIFLTYQTSLALNMIDKPPQIEEIEVPAAEPAALPDAESIAESIAKSVVESAPAGELVPQHDPEKESNSVGNTPVASPDLSSRTKASSKVETGQTPILVQEQKEPVAQQVDKSGQNSYDTDLNSYVLDVIKTYPLGRYPYLLNTDYANYNGVTVNLFYQNRLLLKAHPSGNRATHCSGITFEVFYKAMKNRNQKLGLKAESFNGMSYDQLYDFVMTWYVANGNKRVNNVSTAVEKYGIGRKITRFEEAKAGDFMDISRENNTGHTMVFLNWLRDRNGRIIGLRYWSSQQSTKGINYKEEYFNVRDAKGNKYGNVMIEQVYIARVSPVANYKNFK